MADLRSAFERLMVLEGGGRVHTVAGDPGGTTKWGISQRANPHVDIANLSREGAIEIYREKYWNPLRLTAIRSQNVAEEIFEFAVNAGRHPAVEAAQEAVNHVMSLVFPQQDPLAVDGGLGPCTLAAIAQITAVSALAEWAVVDRFNLLQLRYYRNLRRDLVDRFLLGWTRRVVA